jgi:16S rRNA processing protein RimM
LVRIGRIVAVHGLRGAVRFRPDYPESDSIQSVERIFLADSDDGIGAREHRIVQNAPHTKGTARLMLEGIIDVNGAEALIGKTVFADENDLPPLEANEFYYRDVIGCEVFLTDGNRLGLIEEIIATGANDVFVVRGGGKEILVPVIEDVVKAIDVASKRVIIDPIPGLLD